MNFIQHSPKILAIILILIVGIGIWVYAGSKKETATKGLIHTNWSKNAVI